MKHIFILFFISILSFTCNLKDEKKLQQEQGKEPTFIPYKYKYSIEELHENFSKEMIAFAKQDMKVFDSTNQVGPYKPNIESLKNHKIPQWYLDAKLCIFYDWGLYSIAGYGEKEWKRARYPDWYLAHMYKSLKDYHENTWGKDFHRDDFIPLLTAENFNAKEVVELVKMSGAKYLIPFNKHHDGYTLWDSKYTQRDVVDMMPGRDLTQELVEECKKAGIYHGFYYSVEDYEYPMIDENDELKVRYWQERNISNDAGAVKKDGDLWGEFISEKHNRLLSGKIPVTNFVNEYMVPQAKEFIDKYDPDILWFDGAWTRPKEVYRTPDIVSYFYNQAEGKKEVVVNDRWGYGTRVKQNYGDFYTSETDDIVQKIDRPWEENRSMSESYGFNRLDSLSNYLTADELVEMFVRIVAKGGNLNLMVNPDGSGKVNDIQYNLLKELGDWLKLNGEAIYGSIPYEVIADDTQLGRPVWYTQSKDGEYGYAIVFDWPKSETFICTGAKPENGTEIYMLGHDKPLEWVNTGQKLWGVSAKIPEEMLHNPESRPSEYAWVLKFKYDKNLD